MKIEDVPIEKIHIGLRFRKDEGDLESLAANIRELGLLQPIGVDDYYNLVFGLRRLRACRDILEWHAIPSAVLKIESLIAGEYAENEFRKQFTTSERTAIGEAMEAELGNRKGVNLHPSVAAIAATQEKGKTVDLAAKRAGFTSAETFERAKTVTHKGAPELITAMDQKNVSSQPQQPSPASRNPNKRESWRCPKTNEAKSYARSAKRKLIEKPTNSAPAISALIPNSTTPSNS